MSRNDDGWAIWTSGFIVGLMVMFVVLGLSLPETEPSAAFKAVCEDRGGVTYGATGCFDPDDAVYVEDDK